MEENKQKMCPMVAGENFYFSCRTDNCALWDAENARCAFTSIVMELRQLVFTIDWAARLDH